METCREGTTQIAAETVQDYMNKLPQKVTEKNGSEQEM